jgi:hypothetical protein
MTRAVPCSEFEIKKFDLTYRVTYMKEGDSNDDRDNVLCIFFTFRLLEIILTSVW